MLHTEEKDYALKYTFNSMCEYEERYGKMLIAESGKRGMAPIRRLIWAGLLWMKDGTTEEKAGEIIESAINAGSDLITIREEIQKAIDEANFITRLTEASARRKAEKASENTSAS